MANATMQKYQEDLARRKELGSRRMNAYGQELAGPMGLVKPGSKPQWNPSTNLAAYQNELLESGNARFTAEQKAAQTAGAQDPNATGMTTGNEAIMKSMSLTPTPETPQAPDYLVNKGLQDFGAAYAKQWPKLKEATTLAEYDAQFNQIFKNVPDAEAARLQIEDQYYNKFMPDRVKAEKAQRDLIERLTPEQKERYEVLPDGRLQERADWTLTKTEESEKRKFKTQLDMLEEREKLKGKQGLGTLGNDIWKDLGHDAQAAKLKEYDELKRELRDIEKNYAKAELPKEQTQFRAMQNRVLADIKEFQDTYFKTGGETATATAPTSEAPAAAPLPTATGPNGEKLVLRNGAWVPM